MIAYIVQHSDGHQTYIARAALIITAFCLSMAVTMMLMLRAELNRR